MQEVLLNNGVEMPVLGLGAGDFTEPKVEISNGMKLPD
jgi:hypothetical protein